MGAETCEAAAAGAYGAAARLRNLTLALALLLPLPAMAQPLTILAFGDSLTAGYGLPEEQGFVPQLQAWLAAHGAADVTVTNGGVSGDTTAGGLARVGWALDADVDAVIVELGGNDLLRGLEPGAARSNLDGILAAIKARGLPVLLAGVPVPTNYGPDYQRSFAAIYPELAAKYGALYAPSFLVGVTAASDRQAALALMQPDGIHPNAAGVTADVAALGPAVLELVAAARK